MTIQAGFYDLSGKAGLIIGLAAGGSATAAFLARHSDQKYFAGSSQVVGGAINEFNLYSVPGGPVQARIRVEAVPGGSLIVRCAELPDLAGEYVRL